MYRFYRVWTRLFGYWTPSSSVNFWQCWSTILIAWDTPMGILASRSVVGSGVLRTVRWLLLLTASWLATWSYCGSGCIVMQNRMDLWLPVSITIIVITVNLDLAFCVVSVRGGPALDGGWCCIATWSSAQTFQIVYCLRDEGVWESCFWSHSNIDFPFDAFLYKSTVKT